MSYHTEGPKKENATDSPPNQDRSPREMIEQAMAATVMEVLQLRRTLWLILKQAGKPMIVDERECHPLWRMKATRLGDGRAQLEAVQLPDPTEAELTHLTEMLNGTRMELDAAMAQTPLKDHPPQYIQMCLHNRVRLAESGYWVNAKLLDIGDSKPSGNN